jgi:hypothetical protein
VNKEFAEKLSGSGVRVAGIWPILGLTDALPRAFETAIEGRPLPAEIAALIPNYDPDEEVDGDSFSEAMGDAYWKGMFGYIVAADCMSYTATSPSSAECSWGRYRTKLFYADTVEAALSLAMEWADQEFKTATGAYVEKAAA